jgi:hypothetical protein
MASTREAAGPELDDNHAVEYAALYHYADVGMHICLGPLHREGRSANCVVAQSEAVQQFELLIRALTEVGLDTTVRPGDDSRLLVFVKAKERQLQKAIHRSR